MIKIQRPKTKMFEYMLEDGEPEPIVDKFSIFLEEEEDYILSFITDKELIFLHSSEVSKCYKMMDIASEEEARWGSDIDETTFADTFAEKFAKRVRFEMELSDEENPLWFFPLIELAYSFYGKKYVRSQILGF